MTPAIHDLAADVLQRPWTARRVSEHLRDHAGDYFHDLAGSSLQVALVHERARSNSHLLEFTVGEGAVEYPVIVKIPYSKRRLRQLVATEPHTDRPRLFAQSELELKGLYEYRAMEAIERHFSALGDERFGTIRTLDLLPSPYGIVMEKGVDACLRAQMFRANRLQRRFLATDPRRALHNAGAWLREYQTLPPLEHTKDRHTTRGEFLDSIDQFIGYLMNVRPNRSFIESLRGPLAAAARRSLPQQLPMGLCHGDYAARNILVAPDGRATVFDTLARWRTPVYEDVSYFLMRMKAAGPQLCGLGLLYSPQLLGQYEAAFLRGYFAADAVRRDAVRLFECLLLLEWWAALDFRFREARGLRRPAKATRAAVWSRCLARYLKACLKDLDC